MKKLFLLPLFAVIPILLLATVSATCTCCTDTGFCNYAEWIVGTSCSSGYTPCTAPVGSCTSPQPSYCESGGGGQVCGNGKIEGDEECDTSVKGCSSDFEYIDNSDGANLRFRYLGYYCQGCSCYSEEHICPADSSAVQIAYDNSQQRNVGSCVIPEFTTIGMGLAVIGAGAGFALIRRKRK